MTHPSVNSIVERLEPCPFCGGPAAIRELSNGSWQVECNNDETCTVCADARGDSREKVANRWNTRPAATIISELQAAVDRLQIEIFELKHGVEDQMEEAAYHRERRAAAESSLSRIKAETIEALRPFADALQDVDDAARDDWHLWESPAAMNLNVGDLRRADTAIRSLGSTGGMDSEKTAESKHSPSTQNTRTE